MCAAVATRRGPGTRRVVFYVHTLEHLRRGGRIGSASALLGSALAIKPILSLRDGHIEPIEKVRTSGQGSGSDGGACRCGGRCCARSRSDRGRIGPARGFRGDKASEVATALADRISDAGEIVIGALGAVVGAHVGPGTVAITVSPRVALA
jgi:DegV family protein with EDD domain